MWVADSPEGAAWVALSTCQQLQVTCTPAFGVSQATPCCSLDLVTCKRNLISVRRALTCEPTFASGSRFYSLLLFLLLPISHLRIFQGDHIGLCFKIAPPFAVALFCRHGPRHRRLTQDIHTKSFVASYSSAHRPNIDQQHLYCNNHLPSNSPQNVTNRTDLLRRNKNKQ